MSTARPEAASVWVVGCGLMGSQIAVEYVMAGHRVEVLARDPDAARGRLAAAGEVAAGAGLTDCDDVLARLDAVEVVSSLDGSTTEPDVIVESLPEDLAVKVSTVRPLVERAPEAVVASNTSSLLVTDLGAALGAPTRTVGSHYWNPPLLMPLVELVVTAQTDPAVADRVEGLLLGMGKRPVRVGDVAGFVWNRLQFCVLREAAWIADHGIATPEQIDLVVRDGLARRWSHAGPFASMGLGGASTFATIADNLFPELSTATSGETLPSHAYLDAEQLGALRQSRDAHLTAALRVE